MILDNQIDDHLNESNTSDDESVASSIEDIEDNNKEETQVFRSWCDLHTRVMSSVRLSGRPSRSMKSVLLIGYQLTN